MSLSSLTLNAKRMRVIAVSSSDGIDRETAFTFWQCGQTVWASYDGGNIAKGFLIGTVSESEVEFDYIQVTRAGRRDKGSSRCTLEQSAETNLLRLTERFEWSSREGSGLNILEEIRE